MIITALISIFLLYICLKSLVFFNGRRLPVTMIFVESVFSLCMIAYLSYFYFITADIFQLYVVPYALLQITLIITLLLFGIGVGIRGALLLLNNAHDVLNEIIVKLLFPVSFSAIFFLIVVMESSKPNIYSHTLYERLLLTILAAVAGTVYAFSIVRNFTRISILQVVFFVTMFVVLIAVYVESNTFLALAGSYLFFISGYLLGVITYCIYRRVKRVKESNIEQLSDTSELLNKDSDSEEAVISLTDLSK